MWPIIRALTAWRAPHTVVSVDGWAAVAAAITNLPCIVGAVAEPPDLLNHGENPAAAPSAGGTSSSQIIRLEEALFCAGSWRPSRPSPVPISPMKHDDYSAAVLFPFGARGIYPDDDAVSPADSSKYNTSSPFSIRLVHHWQHSSASPFRAYLCSPPTPIGLKRRLNSSKGTFHPRSRGFSTSRIIKYDRQLLYPHPILPYVDPSQYKVPLVYRLPEDVPLIGQTVDTSVDLLNENGMIFCHSLVQEVDTMDRYGVSPRYPLQTSDLLVSALGRLEIRDGTLLVSHTHDHGGLLRDQFWSSASHVLKKMLSESVGCRQLNLSKDFKELCNRMESPVCVKGYPLVYHISMLPLRRRTVAYMELYEYISLLPKRVRIFVMSRMPHMSKWPLMVEENSLMRNWFDYREYDINDPDHFFTYGRHTRAHGMSYRHYAGYTFEDIERIWQYWCPSMISALYFELWLAEERLIALGPHRLFPYTSFMPLPNNIVADKAYLF